MTSVSAYGGQYRKAKAQAFARSGGVCQACGMRPADSAHHWSQIYPSGNNVIADDLVALCQPCHAIVTMVRRFQRAGGSPFKILSVLEAGLQQRSK